MLPNEDELLAPMLYLFIILFIINFIIEILEYTERRHDAKKK